MSARRICSLLLATCLASVAFVTAPASAQWTSQPVMLGDNDVSIVRGEDTWINVAWTAPTTMENFRMVVQEWQVGTETAYAEGREAAFLEQDLTLSAGEIDVTRFKLTTSDATPERFFIQVVAEWEFEGETYRYFPGGLNLRLVDFDGEQYKLLTDDATVSSRGDGASNWVELDFLGLAPMTSDISVAIEGDVPIYYPQETFTSLHHDARLRANERDVARFWVDPTTVSEGSEEVILVVQWLDADGQLQSDRFPFVLDIL